MRTLASSTFKVLNFNYNGLFVKISGNAPYTASFVKWTTDPGVAVFKCSDGKERTIPTIAVVGFKTSDYPPPRFTKRQLELRSKTGFLFGQPCNSN